MEREVFLFCLIIALLLTAAIGACAMAILFYLEEQAQARRTQRRRLHWGASQ